MEKEKIILYNKMKVFCVTAETFPEGIKEAHEKLHTLVPFINERRYFGISRPNEKGIITYKAAAEEMFQGEAEKFNCETFIIDSGQYISTTIYDYTKDVQSISKAFQELTAYPNIDPQGYCIEWYMDNKEVRCMIKLKT